ncbi:M23 family metallopeptidase [Paenibacillus sp. 2TAB19]|uniref:M23 family metallopeptidase n=1 Tax=Paenibacillus sp. 2TAB19 TaxID=3233003 RepID=UPI003F9BC1DC
MKNILLVLLSSLIILYSSLTINASVVSAADYDPKFSEVYGVTNIVTSGVARSPLRMGTAPTASDSWAYITSKNNQPRGSGDTNPHQGTDIRAGANTNVYSILPGKVALIKEDATTIAAQLGSIFIQYDVNGDGTYDNYYVRYTHIIPEASLNVGDIVSNIEVIGVVDVQKAYGPHLHMQSVTSTTTYKTTKMYNYFTGASSWDFGHALDYFAADSYVGNSLYISAYAHTTGPDGIFRAEKVELYYKKGSTGTWTKSTTNLSPYSTYRWTIDLKAATGASVGNTIYYYLVATRAGSTSTPADPSFTGSYKVGFWPQYFEHPSAPLSATNANLMARVFVIT